MRSKRSSDGMEAGADDYLFKPLDPDGLRARGGDALYRYGGEEFLCIFPEQRLRSGTVVERPLPLVTTVVLTA